MAGGSSALARPPRPTLFLETQTQSQLEAFRVVSSKCKQELAEQRQRGQRVKRYRSGAAA